MILEAIYILSQNPFFEIAFKAYYSILNEKATLKTNLRDSRGAGAESGKAS